MELIYSKIDPSLLLHIIFRNDNFNAGRIDIIDVDNFLQCAALRLDKGKTFKPHKHITSPIINSERKSQESWCVLQGKVQCHLYDIDDTIISEPILHSGDASFTLHGGHTYTILEDNSKIFEYKTGPYTGQINDKTFI